MKFQKAREVDVDNNSKVVIIGAGLAGISAASRLIEFGLDDVTILEAEDRIGGRVHSIPFASGAIDLGAQWCHGEKENAVFEMVHDHFEFGQSKFTKNGKNEFIVSNGVSVDQEKCAQIMKLLAKIAEEVGDRAGSVGSNIETELSITHELGNFDEEMIRKLVECFEKQTTLSYGSESWLDVSSAYQKFKQSCDGNQMLSWKTLGFQKVFDYITVSFLELKL